MLAGRLCGIMNCWKFAFTYASVENISPLRLCDSFQILRCNCSTWCFFILFLWFCILSKNIVHTAEPLAAGSKGAW